MDIFPFKMGCSAFISTCRGNSSKQKLYIVKRSIKVISMVDALRCAVDAEIGKKWKWKPGIAGTPS